ncbi:MAG: hypothetical protein EOO04_11145 [Chitinophagaceae bacterium]|nr:MAG: hypothetical protein EOO04_11145 [Chitinophagaceae bacterium]
MKKSTISLSIILLISFFSDTAMAQEALVFNQNPRFAQSRDRYIYLADSLNSWHSTTFQETYKAIDYLADKREARERRREFHRQLRLERARNGYGWYNDYSYYPANGYGYYNNYRYNSSYYGRQRRGNGFWIGLPVTVGLGWYW